MVFEEYSNEILHHGWRSLEKVHSLCKGFEKPINQGMGQHGLSSDTHGHVVNTCGWLRCVSLLSETLRV